MAWGDSPDKPHTPYPDQRPGSAWSDKREEQTLAMVARQEEAARKRKDLTLISLFTGCGGLDLGFEDQGFETLVCVDNDYEACKTLRFNRPEWEVYEGDIANFSTSGRKATGVIGGPPCQGFSTAGKGNPDDPRNVLWQQYFRVVSDVLPDFILLENVPGMLHSKNRAHLDDLLASFETLGYVVSYDVVNAADYGVPQNRRRLIVIGGRGFSIPFPEPTCSTPVTVREAISDLASSTTAANHEPNNHAPHVVERWQELAEGETDPGYRRSRLYADKPSCTIRAGGGYGPKGNHLGGFHPPIHYELPRQLTVRESARIQGFPDHWILKGSKTAQGRQIGNAVAPPLASALAKTIRKSLDTHWPGKPQRESWRDKAARLNIYASSAEDLWDKIDHQEDQDRMAQLEHEAESKCTDLQLSHPGENITLDRFTCSFCGHEGTQADLIEPKKMSGDGLGEWVCRVGVGCRQDEY